MVVRILGAGLAGCEAAWQVVSAGHSVELYEMRPKVMTKAHSTGLCAELVCSNSLRGADLSNAVGLLKEELKLLGSLIMESALHAQGTAGGALAVDRLVFAQYIDQHIREHPRIQFHEMEVQDLPPASPDEPLIVATGPLTSPALTEAIERFTGQGYLAFFDAISPIVFDESVDHSVCFRQSRYDKGEGDDYLNLPLEREEYYTFVDAVAAAEKYTGNEAVENDSLERLRPFEGCMPIEDMVARGKDTLLFGPFKPVGLTNPHTGRRPYAVLQLRQDDKEGRLWSMVGMQTRMKRHEQQRIFTSLPGLAGAEFVRYGTVHRNTFIDSPKCLNATLEHRAQPGLFFAGQITGTEGYVESTAGGLAAGLNAVRSMEGRPLLCFPIETAIGALLGYISDPERKDFQPMNVSFGLMPTYLNGQAAAKAKRISKKDRRLETAQIALQHIRELQTVAESTAA